MARPRSGLTKAGNRREADRIWNQLMNRYPKLADNIVKSPGGFRFNPKAKLDPSQVEDYRNPQWDKVLDSFGDIGFELQWPFLRKMYSHQGRMQGFAELLYRTFHQGRPPPRR